METKEMQAIKRLLKKLSALRATLSDDERALLDGFIVTPKADDEVQAHMFPPGALPPGALPPGALPPGAFDEVQAHMLPPGALPPGALPPGAFDEVQAHMLPPGALPPGAPDEVQAHILPPYPRWEIVFDSVKQVYKIA